MREGQGPWEGATLGGANGDDATATLAGTRGGATSLVVADGKATTHALGGPDDDSAMLALADADSDATILAIAARQQGLISRSQLLRAGVAAHVIDYRLRKGRLRAVHRGVYRTGPLAGPLAREMAAVLVCGDRAVLSHRTASALWELTPPSGPATPVEVIGPRSLRGHRRGVRVHRVSRLDPDEVGRKHGLPLTTPARTLIDLASCATPRELERALARAERRSITREAIGAALARSPHGRGGSTLRALLSATGGPALTRSEAEARFLTLVRKGGIPHPHANVVVEGVEVDFVWRKQRLVVEIDGFQYHAGRAAFDRDRRRDGMLSAAGFGVIRFTWRQLTEEPATVLVRLASALVFRSRKRSWSEAP